MCERGLCLSLYATRDRIRRHNQHMESQTFSVRLDIWLWAARFFKTRQLAKQAIDGGKVALNGVAGKPAKLIRDGDTLRISRALEHFAVRVLAVSEQRGPAAAARATDRKGADRGT